MTVSLRHSIVRGVGANTLGQAVVAVNQLISVPVYLAYWGASLYGEWLSLFTLTAYIALCDFGFAIAAGNDMTLAVARNDRAGAARTYQSVRVGIGVVTVFVLVASTSIVLLLPSGAFPRDQLTSAQDIRLCIIFLIVYALIAVHHGVAMAGFRCAGMYPKGVNISTAIVACEACLSIAVVIGGGELVASAAALAVFRMFATPLTFRLLHRRAKWLVGEPARIDLSVLRRLVQPSLATLGIPVGTAITLQGTVLVIANVQSPAAVALFTSTRTLTRLVLQVAATISNAVMPEFTRVVGRDEAAKATSLFVANFILAAVIVVPSVVILSLEGVDIIQLWTAGRIVPPENLVVGLAVLVGLHTMWHFVMNLLLAVNRHQVAAWQYPVVALAGLVCGVFALREFGLDGVVATGICVELWMLIVVWRCYHRFMPLNPAKLAAAARDLRFKSVRW